MDKPVINQHNKNRVYVDSAILSIGENLYHIPFDLVDSLTNQGVIFTDHVDRRQKITKTLVFGVYEVITPENDLTFVYNLKQYIAHSFPGCDYSNVCKLIKRNNGYRGYKAKLIYKTHTTYTMRQIKHS